MMLRRNRTDKVRSLNSERVESDPCALCHAFTLHVHGWGKLNRLCVIVLDNGVALKDNFPLQTKKIFETILAIKHVSGQEFF